MTLFFLGVAVGMIICGILAAIGHYLDSKDLSDYTD